MTAFSSSSFAIPASRRNGEPNAGPGARGGWEVVRPFEELEPELEFPLVMIRPLCHRDIHFLLCIRNDSLISTWIVATIGQRRTGGEDERAITWRWEEVDEDRDFLRRVMVLGSESPRLPVGPILLRPPRISQETR